MSPRCVTAELPAQAHTHVTFQISALSNKMRNGSPLRSENDSHPRGFLKITDIYINLHMKERNLGGHERKEPQIEGLWIVRCLSFTNSNHELLHAISDYLDFRIEVFSVQL